MNNVLNYIYISILSVKTPNEKKNHLMIPKRFMFSTVDVYLCQNEEGKFRLYKIETT